jgi:deoxycytidylate deaminase
MSMETGYRQAAEIMIHALADAQVDAEHGQECRRKSVGCVIYDVCVPNRRGPRLKLVCAAKNGPTSGYQCTNEIGNCGCAHAEPRALFAATRAGWTAPPDRGAMVLLCKYSPCTPCAHAILASRFITHVIFEIVTEHDQRGLTLLHAGLDGAMPLKVLERIVRGEAPEAQLEAFKRMLHRGELLFA